MLLDTVNCLECGNNISLMGEIAVKVVLETASWCKKCANCKTEKREFHFCCQGCFHKYMKKVLEGEAEFKWHY